MHGPLYDRRVATTRLGSLPWYRRVPPYQWGPKVRRRTELGLLLLGDAIVVALYVLASLAERSRIPPHIGWFFAILLALTIVPHLANRWLAPEANPIILPIVAVLNGIGYVVIARWDPADAKAQAGWTAIGVVLYVTTLLVVRRPRDLDRYRYLLLLLAGLLILSPLFPGIGESVGGARLWVHLGSLSFQPIELAKILLCIFFASYFAENKELLSIPTARVGNRLVVDFRPLIPIVILCGLALGAIGLEGDIAFAVIIFVLFVAMLWTATGRLGYLLLGLALFAAAALLASHLFTQVHVRVADWLDPWRWTSSSPQCATPTQLARHPLCGTGDQLVQGWFAMGNGGIGGTGIGLGVWPQYHGIYLYSITSDMIFAAIGEELGLLGTSAVALAFLLIVGAGLRIAQTARSDFSRLLATGLTVVLGFQAFFIMAGVTRLLPFTGITLPFMAYGGSSLIANYILIAILMRISEEGAATPAERRSGVSQPGERAFVRAM